MGAQVGLDALIGADGIHSTVREALFGPQPARFTGCVGVEQDAVPPPGRARAAAAEMASEATDCSIEAVAWLYGHDAGRIRGGPDGPDPES